MDYSISCNSKEYKSRTFIIGLAATMYASCIPAIFIFFMHMYKTKHDFVQSKRAQKALAWMHIPFRYGYSWWLCCEMIRVLILSSWIGFTGQKCWTKMPVTIVCRSLALYNIDGWISHFVGVVLFLQSMTG